MERDWKRHSKGTKGWERNEMEKKFPVLLFFGLSVGGVVFLQCCACVCILSKTMNASEFGEKEKFTVDSHVKTIYL